MPGEDELRKKLTGLSGPARARPLLDLAQALTDRYWRAGPGKPEALPLLDEAIAAADEAYGYFGAGDAMRRSVAGLRGWLHATRHLAHFGAEEDRTIGIEQLEEALREPDLPPMMYAICRLTLGQLYLVTVNRALQAPDVAARIMSGGLPASAAGEVDRATACFEEVAGSATLPQEARESARILLRMAGALRTIVTASGGGSGLAAINQLMDAMSVFREIHEEQTALVTASPGGFRSFYDAERIADQAPLDRPVALLEFPDEAPGSSAARPSPARDPGDPAALRRELRARVSAGGDLFEALEALLDPGAAPPPARLVDDVVALATEVADLGAATPTDDLLLAAGLCLRARSAGGDRARRDLEEAVDALLRAASAPRPATPEAVRVMRRLAAIADSAVARPARPGSAGTVGRAEDRLSYVLDSRMGNRR